MSPTLQLWVWFCAIAFLVLLTYAIVTLIKQHLIANRLAVLAEDILSFGRSTLTKHLQQCEFCKNTSHVSVWEYGNEHTVRDVLICYLCASRLAKLLEPPALPKNGVPSYDQHHAQRNEQPAYRSRSRQTLARR